LQAPVRANSQKPDEFYRLVELQAPRYAELFARTTRPNWDGHGDEVSDAPAIRAARGEPHDREIHPD
jgi:N6-adenosine-specific RNA methylase IME4